MANVREEAAQACGAGLNCALKESCVDVEDAIGYTTYGIIVSDHSGAKQMEVEDISTDRPLVEELIHLLEREKVWIGHIRDVLDDYLP